MGNGTRKSLDPFETGRRIRECREMRGLSRKQLIDRIELLADNGGKGRSEKQISYLENGTRELSLEYATLIAQALQVRSEYLLLKDNYKTDGDRVDAFIDSKYEKRRLITQLMQLHGYEIVAKEFPVDVKRLSPEELEEYNKNPYNHVKYAIESNRSDRDGIFRILEPSEVEKIYKDIDDFIEFTCSKYLSRIFDDYLQFKFRKRSDNG